MGNILKIPGANFLPPIPDVELKGIPTSFVPIPVSTASLLSSVPDPKLGTVWAPILMSTGDDEENDVLIRAPLDMKTNKGIAKLFADTALNFVSSAKSLKDEVEGSQGKMYFPHRLSQLNQLSPWQITGLNLFRAGFANVLTGQEVRYDWSRLGDASIRSGFKFPKVELWQNVKVDYNESSVVTNAYHITLKGDYAYNLLNEFEGDTLAEKAYELSRFIFFNSQYPAQRFDGLKISDLNTNRDQAFAVNNPKWKDYLRRLHSRHFIIGSVNNIDDDLSDQFSSPLFDVELFLPHNSELNKSKIRLSINIKRFIEEEGNWPLNERLKEHLWDAAMLLVRQEQAINTLKKPAFVHPTPNIETTMINVGDKLVLEIEGKSCMGVITHMRDQDIVHVQFVFQGKPHTEILSMKEG
ncbi:hypothetical protein BVY03_00040, partial [bacterium K02(2017)]